MRPIRSLPRPAWFMITVVACVLAPPQAHAATSLTVGPQVLRLEAAAGETITADISVGAGKEGFAVELVHADFGFDEATYETRLIRDDAPETTAFSTRGWFSFPKQRYRIPANRTRSLPLRIKVPANTPGGTYLGAALIRTLPTAADANASQVLAVQETGPLIFLAIEGGDPPRPAYRSFEVPRLVESGPISPVIVMESRGDHYFSFEGTITLTGGGEDQTVDVGRQFVVPGEPRLLRTAADPKDAGKPRLGTEKLGFGRYEVRSRLRIEPTGATLVATRVVWVVPTFVRVLAALFVLVLLGCIALLARWFVRRRDDRATDAIDAVDDAFDDDVESPLNER